MYVPTVNTPSKKCPDLPYIDTDTNEAKYKLNIAVYYYGIMSVNINWKELWELEIYAVCEISFLNSACFLCQDSTACKYSKAQAGPLIGLPLY